MLHVPIEKRMRALDVREVQQFGIAIALVGELGAGSSAAPFDDMTYQAFLFLEELLGEIDLLHPRRGRIMAMAKIASHLDHLFHRESVLRRERAREHRIVPSGAALMSPRYRRRRSVAAVAWSASESRELMLRQPVVHRMRFQRLGDSGGKNRRPFVAEMAGDAAVGHSDLGNPDLLNSRLKIAGIFGLAVVAEQLRELPLIAPPFSAELAPETD